jgi:hypothetical protein
MHHLVLCVLPADFVIDHDRSARLVHLYAKNWIAVPLDMLVHSL